MDIPFLRNEGRSGERRNAGVSFVVRYDVLKRFAKLHVPLRERPITLQFYLKGGRFATPISAYIAVMKIQILYISGRFLKIPKPLEVVLLVDFNARVGTDWQTWSFVLNM